MANSSCFEISDLGKPKVDDKRFHYNVTNKMKDDMKDAYIRLIGKDIGYKFAYPSKQTTIVDGIKRNSREGYNSDLCLRIDLQDTHIEPVAGKEMKVANVQIQLNKKERPSTIAQVHFQCGVDIPKDEIIRAFEKSWTEKKIIYVFVKWSHVILYDIMLFRTWRLCNYFFNVFKYQHRRKYCIIMCILQI